MGTVTNLADYRNTTKIERDLNKRRKDLIQRFLNLSTVFFEKANSKKGIRMVKDLKRVIKNFEDDN